MAIVAHVGEYRKTNNKVSISSMGLEILDVALAPLRWNQISNPSYSTDHGKTTLVDALLRLSNGETNNERLLDCGELEIERGITIRQVLF